MAIVKDVFHFVNITRDKISKIPPHTIDFYDLTFIIKGEMIYKANGKTIVMRDNDAIFLKPGTLRERLEGKQKTKYVSFNFRLNEDLPLDSFLEGIINEEIKRIASVYPQNHFSNIFYSKEKLESILDYILYEMLELSNFKIRNEHIIKIFKYIEKNINQRISLEDVSRDVNLAKEYVSSLFKKETGKTITEYINERKMTIAKSIIENDNLSLKKVAESLGYDNYSYFSRVFKKYYSISPIKRRN